MENSKKIMIVLVIIICITVIVAATKLINKDKPKGKLESATNKVYEEYQNLTENEQSNIKDQINAIMDDGLGIDDLNKPLDLPEEMLDYIYKPAVTDPAKEFLGIE